MNFQNLAFSRPRHWNGRWWIILADVPTLPFRQKADQFRNKLKSMGVFPLQRTVWVYPYDPRSEIAFVANHYGIDRFVTTMEVVTLDPDDENKIRNHFNI